ncbi:MAG: hypothetical protein WHT81_06550, partial [Rectinemataceae bacterium]
SMQEPLEIPPVLKTIAETGAGVAEVADAILSHFARLRASGELERKRLGTIGYQLDQFVLDQLAHLAARPAIEALKDNLAHSVLRRKTDIYSAGLALFHALLKEGEPHEHPEG